ncbi:BREX-1 system adenine-specific DNA-methyltransferase PglX [Chryseobacterium suipulveris]|uniref:site-specific DNA-methyltransferase (adenine-specific) n=1 Tax=Chryseobacterium suipulveris TaxID=2929800 RepID=A0ABY4BRD6_9FLAO|nr:N-6 DNA methylase [Chryseobacterium suipulveris]UOE41324.1 BREX-1 system adenine-specific DNA-methyltransferase PglX [Chryseobacterium suipulveris]
MFQKTIIKKYLKSQNQEEIDRKWMVFSQHFHNPAIQENIRNSKEEQYQEGFLRDLFVKVFDYVLNPHDGFNLTTELRNIKDTKKADGGILVDEKVVGVIELKGTNTIDLGKVESQAFNYKSNQPGCLYVITSNFEKLRFYIEDTVHFQEFNLFTLNKEDFSVLHLFLSFDNIKNNVPKKIKDESVSQEDVITKKLYKDYSVFKQELFQNFVEQNPDYDQLELFQKTQKLLDRLLFLFFGEDRGLLPPNSVRQILNQWNKLKDLDEYVPLYSRFKKYFGYLNTGFKGKNHDVFAYNGGLFKPDEILDNITIDDDLLYRNTLKLSDYDFASEVDVNILGHIFENSLNEIDEIKAQIEGKEIEKSKTKRKKDGVFYTPKYITKYIVENTVGKLCEEKKAEFGIVEEEYSADRKRQEKTKKILLEKLVNYRKWLLQITILDPACGSGAFLNEALNFLIEEHHYIDVMESKLTGSSITFTYHSESILENNLFGVDLNEESVEIAKLSLWLRTAVYGRKLNDLSSNIKCGNSLIDDPKVAGEKAFNWEQEFPQVFKEKKTYHLVFTTHNSRTSARMRRLGIVPGKPAELSLPQEIKLAEIFAQIAKDYDLDILAWNVCKDHVHISLTCSEDELLHQVRLMKSISSKMLNRWMTETSAAEVSDTAPVSATPTSTTSSPMGLDPLQNKDPLQNTDSLQITNLSAITEPSQIDDPLQIDKSRHRDALEDPASYFPGEHDNHLWSQKFFSVDTESWEWLSDQESGFPYEVTHFSRVLEYIEENRVNHMLPKSDELEKIISGFTKTPEEVYRNKYKGGFDVVIGNPPYVNIVNILNKEERVFYQSKYKTVKNKSDLYSIFIEKGYGVLKDKGLLSFIFPNSWLGTESFSEFRRFIIDNTKILELIKLPNDVFADAVVTPIILSFKKEKTIDHNIILKELINNEFLTLRNKLNYNRIKKSPTLTFSFSSEIKFDIETFQLGEIADFSLGIKTSDDNRFIFDRKIDDSSYPILRGRNITRYYYSEPTEWIWYKPELITQKAGGRPRILENFLHQKIYIQDISKRINACYCEEPILSNDTLNLIYDVKGGFTFKTILVLMNSKLINKWFESEFQEGLHIKINQLQQIPIPKNLQNSQSFIIEKADKMLSLNKAFQELSGKFQRNLQMEFSVENLSKKLQSWEQLSYGDFLKELGKLKINLSLSQKSEWEDYFLAEQKKVLEIQNQINTTDKEIDQMVYELYGLTEEEIEIVEKS